MKGKHLLQPLETEGGTYECANSKVWPPLEVVAYKEDLIDPLPDGVPISEGFRGVLPDLTYRRIKTWLQVCGLMEMEAEKCLTCPHLLKDGTRVAMGGTGHGRTIHNPYPGKDTGRRR